jgi:hypothetical protein
LAVEALETRALMSVAPVLESVPAVVAGDTVVPIHAQVGSTALETILGVAEKLDSIEDALNAYLNTIPGWHLTGGIDTTPSYAGMVDGQVVIGANGLLKSAAMTLTGSADIGATIEGYYGTGVLHVGLGAAADLSANISATAAFHIETNTWEFGGSASLDGSVKGYATAMAWPLRGEVYVQGDVEAAAAINSNTGIASASIELDGSVGAKAQLKSLLGGWTTIASVSRSLGSWQACAAFDVGAWMRSEASGVVAVRQAAAVLLTSDGPAAQGALMPGAGPAASATIVADLGSNPPATLRRAFDAGSVDVSDWAWPSTANRSTLTATNRVDAARDSACASLDTTAVWVVVRSDLRLDLERN